MDNRLKRKNIRIEDIESDLESLVKAVEKFNIKSIAMPALGCGLGGLDWQDVQPLIEKAFIQMPATEIFLFNPYNNR